MAEAKPRYRVAAGRRELAASVAIASGAPSLRKHGFDAGRSSRRLKGFTSTTQEINRQIRSYGRTVVARSRYLSQNNPYAMQAKKVFVSALAGAGIKPSSLNADADFKAKLQEVWLDWSDEADADGLTDFYGLQATIASEMFDAGECFVRLRARRPEDGLVVPLQLQLLPSEMLPLNDNRMLGNGNYVQMGVEFNAIGKRVAYWFLRQHPGADQVNFRQGFAGEQVRVPADEVLHLFDPTGFAGQIRGIPHTLSAIVTAAILDCYDDAELERKRVAALFGGFIKTELGDDPAPHPLAEGIEAAQSAGNDSAIAMEPGAFLDLDPGQDVTFSEPADVGGNYEAFQYRNLLRQAAGYGVPYAAMTGDLRQANYGSIRAGLVEFRRRIEAMQHAVMVFQFCRPVWRRFMADAVLAERLPVSPSQYAAAPHGYRRAKWIAPRWDWVDPFKDRQAEKLAVDAGFKARSDVIEAEGYDPEETDRRIAADRAREKELGLSFAPAKAPASAPAAKEDDPEKTGDKTDGA
ncbi:phage portal protein [Sinorhizobium sp. 8-89]|uniref:phage portal protein n=1 Tax=Sinorhizobium sp. 7-81 TaxID=3049087 RepID=UPI0024C453B2|nr:phage portal protein [Sinorhizobium sp. 7-81]MDK1386363.1 phage portal protein [Sinorhizobium sp. 7-81]